MARIALKELARILQRMAGVVIAEIRNEPKELVSDIRIGKGYTMGLTKDGCLQVVLARRFYGN